MPMFRPCVSFAWLTCHSVRVLGTSNCSKFADTLMFTNEPLRRGARANRARLHNLTHKLLPRSGWPSVGQWP